MNAERCDPCQEAADRKLADAQHLAEQQAEKLRRIEAEKEARELEARNALRRKCPVCGSTRFRIGILPDSREGFNGQARFKPTAGDWTEEYDLEAMACLDCGHVRLFMADFWRGHLGKEPASEI